MSLSLKSQVQNPEAYSEYGTSCNEGWSFDSRLEPKFSVLHRAMPAVPSPSPTFYTQDQSGRGHLMTRSRMNGVTHPLTPTSS